ncbi:hypothetical protein JTE90_020013 [Oedothorax gibbosus]|uniref:Phospholipase A2 n=1 Tax=Oedothorax gibbosus TaxID=931172 RepID=A0AAV6ULE9_9ARAC|nr:hypothetical protein JTE90_020013 [Oedothorax gibbosus]
MSFTKENILKSVTLALLCFCVRVLVQGSWGKERLTIEEIRENYEEISKAAEDYDIIFPGTKWCGNGNIASNDSDLGGQVDTDRCCRSHDMCNDTILTGETGHGLRNDGPFTGLNCRCENDLYDCLRNVDTFTSNTVGNLYFNILRSRCFREDYPQTDKCKIYEISYFTCVEYEKDTTKPKVYQWFPAKNL